MNLHGNAKSDSSYSAEDILSGKRLLSLEMRVHLSFHSAYLRISPWCKSAISSGHELLQGFIGVSRN